MEGDSQAIDSFQNPLTKEVFGNPVVWDILGGFLGPGDLKDCRKVCKAFDLRVRDCRRWKEGDLWQLNLKEDNWADPQLSSFKVGSSSGITTVKVTLSASGPEETDALEKLSDIFKDTKTLVLEFKETVESRAEKQPDGLSWDDYNRSSKLKKLGVRINTSLAIILGNCSPNLTTLILQNEVLSFLSCTDNSVVFNSPKAIQRIKGLKTFKAYEITDSLSQEQLRLLHNQEEYPVNMLASNFDSIEDLRLNIQGSRDYFAFPQRHLMTLFERRAPVLKKLELGEIDLLVRIYPHGLSHLIFPQLSRLSLRVSGKSMAQTCEFLSNHQPLQSLTLKVQGLLTKALVNVIKEKSGNLCSLKLKFWMIEERVEWEWLKECKKLSSFSLINPTFSQIRNNWVKVDIEDVILCLPNGMRKIVLRSCGWFAPLTTRYGLREVLQNSKFSQLEELSILFLPWAVTDSVMEDIGSKNNFPKMKKLYLSHNYNHNGEVTGEKAFWQGLEDVCLRSVSGVISEESFMEKLGGSNNLRRLTLLNLPVTTIAMAALEKVVKSFKSLDTLVINKKGSTVVDEKFWHDLPHRAKLVQHGPTTGSVVEDNDSDSDVEEGLITNYYD